MLVAYLDHDKTYPKSIRILLTEYNACNLEAVMSIENICCRLERKGTLFGPLTDFGQHRSYYQKVITVKQIPLSAKEFKNSSEKSNEE